MEITPSRGRAEPEDDKPSIYLTLLSLYLSPPHGYKSQYGPALEILAKHGSRLPANSALDLIPESLPVRELEFYFKGRMRAVASLLNETKVVANLHKAEDIKMQAQLLVGEGGDGKSSRSRHVTVTEERICGICHKRLGGSVINVFPECVFLAPSDCCFANNTVIPLSILAVQIGQPAEHRCRSCMVDLAWRIRSCRFVARR